MNSLEAQEIFDRIRKVDWYYNYSDDYSVWKSGAESVKEIRHFIDSREWSSEDIDMLKLASKNIVMLDIRKLTDQQRQDSIDAWNKRIENLFVTKKANHE
jgi:hypothetical protein